MSDLWQNLLSTWKGRMAFLYGKNHMTDCKLILEDGKDKVEIKAHKMVLASCSTKLFKLWFVTEVNCDEIIIRDVSKEVLTAFVYYLYNEHVNLSMQIVWDVLKLAKLYGVASLINFCGIFLMNFINSENFLFILDKIANYGLNSVRRHCLQYLSLECDHELYETPHFYTISRKTLETVLTSKYFFESEIKIFEAVDKWSENLCEMNNLEISSQNKRNGLENSFKKIRFGAMSLEEFNSINKSNSFLTIGEILNIQQYLTLNETKECMFVTRPRLSKFQIDTIYNEDANEDEDDEVPCIINSSIKFYSDCKSTLNGCYIYFKTEEKLTPEDYNKNLSITVWEAATMHVLISEQIEEIQFNESSENYPILLTTPIELERNKNYYLSVNDENGFDDLSSFMKASDLLDTSCYATWKSRYGTQIRSIIYEDFSNK